MNHKLHKPGQRIHLAVLDMSDPSIFDNGTYKKFCSWIKSIDAKHWRIATHHDYTKLRIYFDDPRYITLLNLKFGEYVK